jgi:hypothetical protein
MRLFAVVLSCLLLATALAEARPPSRQARQQLRQNKTKHVAQKRAAVAEPKPAEPRPIDPYADDGDGADADARKPAEAGAPRRDRSQSIGAPWAGRLKDASRLPSAEGIHIRRPHRSFGTRTTVEHVRRAIRTTRDAFPKAHTLAIGDLSAEHGGWISEHASHRSGRDIDLGFFFKKQPAGYPESFVLATNDNLDLPATFSLLANLLDSAGLDGGVQLVFLDYNVQGQLYRWGKDNGVPQRILDQIFQYPHGRSADGLVRHHPNHADHFHVRFRCAQSDTSCY